MFENAPLFKVEILEDMVPTKNDKFYVQGSLWYFNILFPFLQNKDSCAKEILPAF